MRDDWKLIYYHEDGRNELYNLANDPAESMDVFASNSEIAADLSGQLKQWLVATNAKMPTPDPMFDASKRADRWEQIKTRGKEKLETQHAGFLDANYEPDPEWWGSLPRD